MVTVSDVIILSKTNMSSGHICVGGYCLTHRKYLRLLNERAQALSSNEPYEIGQLYRIKYVPRYSHQIIPPHIEDVAVYEKT